tara:strand:+ start:359 stop:601 length:243 start_codon:yes stop_codon:yes gene_type:complete
MNKFDFIIKLLSTNHWGLYYKNNPIEQLTVQNDSPLFKVNEVSLEGVEKAIRELQEKEGTEWKNTTSQRIDHQNTDTESG